MTRGKGDGVSVRWSDLNVITWLAKIVHIRPYFVWPGIMTGKKICVISRPANHQMLGILNNSDNMDPNGIFFAIDGLYRKNQRLFRSLLWEQINHILKHVIWWNKSSVRVVNDNVWSPNFPWIYTHRGSSIYLFIPFQEVISPPLNYEVK